MDAAQWIVRMVVFLAAIVWGVILASWFADPDPVVDFRDDITDDVNGDRSAEWNCET